MLAEEATVPVTVVADIHRLVVVDPGVGFEYEYGVPTSAHAVVPPVVAVNV
jgi:hypothetical protein